MSEDPRRGDDTDSLPDVFPPQPYCPLERRHITLHPETIAQLSAEIQTAVMLGIQQGVRQSITTELAEKLWGVFFTMVRTQSTRQAGRFVLSGMWMLAKKAFLIFVLVSALYSIGGWAALVAAWKVLIGSKA